MTLGDFAETIRHWPGRFRYAELMATLTDADADAEPKQLAAAMLADLGASSDPEAVAEFLLEDGRLGAVRILADQTDLHDANGLKARLTAAERSASDRAKTELDRLRVKIMDLGLSFDIDREALVEKACRDPGAAFQQIEAIETTIDAASKLRAKELRAEAERLAGKRHPSQRQAFLVEVDAAIDRGALETVDRFLRTAAGDATDIGPWFLPYPSNDDLVGDPDTALARIISQTGGTVGFHSAFDSDIARTFAHAYRDLDGSRSSAQALADFLSDHLQYNRIAVSDDLNGIGQYLPFYALHNDSLADRLAPNVTLWIGGPQQTSVPDSVPGFVMAVGPGLSRGSTRSRIAVLEVSDLLRMLQVPARPQVTLLRVASRQWTVDALLPSGDIELDELLGPDIATRQLTVEWIVDLLGLGGMVEAGALVQMSGMRPAIVRRAIENQLIRSGGGPARWEAQPDTLDERPALAGVPSPTPADRAAFWAVLWLNEFGEWVRRDELDERVAAGFDDVTEPALQRLQSGLEQLALNHILDLRDDELRMTRWGYIEPLLARAERHLAHNLKTLAEVTARANEDFIRRLGSILDDLTRHERLAHLRYNKADAAAISALETSAEALVEPGGFDPLTELMAIQADLMDAASGLIVDVVDGPAACPQLNVSRAFFRLAFTELIRNALEANAEQCRVRIALEAVDDDVAELSVSDNGQGVEPSSVLKIFRSGVSGRGSTGDGLPLIRAFLGAVRGEIVLAAGSNPGQFFSGAMFTLRIPVLHNP